jgi:adenine-specific DNA-methyltransferase
MSYTYTVEPETPTVPLTLAAGERHGVVYTKPWVVDLLLDLAGYSVNDDLAGSVAVEPAAGNGSFLAPMVRRLVASCRRQGRPLTDMATSLLAYELDPASAQTARRTVIQTLRELDVSAHQAEALATRWVRTGDYLLEAPTLPPADVVIGNPPYIRLEEMEDAASRRYRHTYRTMVGRADLYVAFFEAALKSLTPQGVCAFICADRWMRNQYGTELRRLVTAGYAVETVVEMHRADAFACQVSAYPAITVIRRAAQGSAVVASVGAGVEQHDVPTLAGAAR